MSFDVAPPRRVPCQGAASASSRGRPEATAAVLMGAASTRTIKRLLRVCSAPPVGHLQDSLASPLTEHQRHDAWRHSAVITWTWEQAAWLSTSCTWLTQDHVPLHAPTTWPRSAPRKVLQWMTTTAGWPPGGDRQSRVRAGLSLLLVLPAALVAWPGWRPPGAPWSCELSAGARSPWDLLRAGACAWWLSCCLAIRLLGCSPGASLAFCSTQVG